MAPVPSGYPRTSAPAHRAPDIRPPDRCWASVPGSLVRGIDPQGADLMSSLFSVALRALPISVPKNQFCHDNHKYGCRDADWDAWAWIKARGKKAMVTMDLDFERRRYLLLPPQSHKLIWTWDIWSGSGVCVWKVSKCYVRDAPVTNHPAILPGVLAINQNCHRILFPTQSAC